MSLARFTAAFALLIGLLGAQEPALRFPATYFIGERGNLRSMAVGPGGDIWGVAVAEGDRLPSVDPEGHPPPEGVCQTGGYQDDIAHPRLGPCTDLHVVRLAGDGSGILFAKYVGGTGVDDLSDIAVDPQGNAYLTGSRASSPDQQPGTSAYLIKLTADGRTQFDLELPSNFAPESIALSPAGNIYVGGATREFNSDAVVIKIDGMTRGIAFQAKLSGSRGERISDIAVDETGRVFVVGESTSPNLPVTKHYAVPAASKLPQQVPDHDVFVAGLDASGEGWAWVPSYGGSRDELFPFVALDRGELLVAATRTRASQRSSPPG